MVLDDAVQLAADVLGGRLHPRQHPHDGVAKCGVQHWEGPETRCERDESIIAAKA